MNTTNQLASALLLALAGSSFSAAAAHVYRTEGEAYQSCRAAIEREVPSRRQLEFATDYGLSEKTPGGAFEFYINLKRPEVNSSERKAYRARCQARGFGPVDTLQVEAGSWSLNVEK